MTTPLNRKSYQRLLLAKDFYWLKIKLCVFRLAVNRQLLLTKIYVGISNNLETVHHQLTAEASNKGIKQIVFLLFLNLHYSNKWNMFNNDTYTYFRTGNKYFSFLSYLSDLTEIKCQETKLEKM